MISVTPIQFTYARALTPNDTPGANSLLNRASFIMCNTAAGNVTVTQSVTSDDHPGAAPTALTTFTFYMAVGDIMAVGASWRNVNSTGTTATGLSALH